MHRSAATHPATARLSRKLLLAEYGGEREPTGGRGKHSVIWCSGPRWDASGMRKMRMRDGCGGDDKVLGVEVGGERAHEDGFLGCWRY